MRAALVISTLALAACNQILGNSSFTGPGDPAVEDAALDGAPADACRGTTCAAAVDASTVCEQMGKPATSISGTVYAPNGTVPLPDVAIYVPTTAVAPIAAGASCHRCGDELTGNPLVVTRSGADGTFRLDHVPAGADVPVVIQIGPWRRQIRVDTTACADTALPAAQTRLPRNHGEGDLPRIALVANYADTLECMMRTIGVDDAEITTHPGSGRVQLYAGSGAAAFASSFPTHGAFAKAETLFSTPDLLDDYDQVLLGCSDVIPKPERTAALAKNLADYADRGGRLLLVHRESEWLDLDPRWDKLGTFYEFGRDPGPGTIAIDQSFPAGQRLAQWLHVTGAAGADGTVKLDDARSTCMSADDLRTRTWATIVPTPEQDFHGPVMFTFETPIAASATPCGRVAFTDVQQSHKGSDTVAFPDECSEHGPQDLLLTFSIFQLSSCVP